MKINVEELRKSLVDTKHTIQHLRPSEELGYAKKSLAMSGLWANNYIEEIKGEKILFAANPTLQRKSMTNVDLLLKVVTLKMWAIITINNIKKEENIHPYIEQLLFHLTEALLWIKQEIENIKKKEIYGPETTL
jgi:hypothetical protein